MPVMKKILLLSLLALLSSPCFCWGFFAHRKINYYAVFLLPPEMMVFYKPSIYFLEEHAVDPDKRRYAIPQEGPRHYIDIDHYALGGNDPFVVLPKKWNEAVRKFSADTLNAHGIVPWWLQTMLARLTSAFKEKDPGRILKYSAELGHYIADSHVPLHACSNHNGQYTDQKGIHGFWESRIPELLAEKEWDFYIGTATYIKDPVGFTWARVMESAAASDSVLRLEKKLSLAYPPDRRFSFEARNRTIIRQYSEEYSRAYDRQLRGMVERRMRQSIFAVASFWYTAWVNAGQPTLAQLVNPTLSAEDLEDFERLNTAWRNAGSREE